MHFIYPSQICALHTDRDILKTAKSLTGLFWVPADHIGNNVVRIIAKGVILVIMVLIEVCVLINATLPWLESKETNKPYIRVEK